LNYTNLYADKSAEEIYNSLSGDIAACDPSNKLEAEILQKRIETLESRVLTKADDDRADRKRMKKRIADLELARTREREGRRVDTGMATRERIKIFDDIRALKQQLADKLQRSTNDEYRALKKAEKAEKELAQVKNKLKNQQELMNNTPNNTADTLRQAILSSESGEMTKQTAIKELAKLEEGPPHELDNSLAMDIPDEIREAAKKAGIGLEDLTDLILTIKREQREEKQWEREHMDRNSLELEQARHVRQQENGVCELNRMKENFDHNYRMRKLDHDHDKVIMQIRVKDNVNKRETKVKIAELKANVKIKNDHGVSVGEDRWQAVEVASGNLGRAVRWAAIAGAGSYIAYAISQVFLTWGV
jgi:hypothetical protein